jgi:hypothetical protein
MDLLEFGGVLEDMAVPEEGSSTVRGLGDLVCWIHVNSEYGLTSNVDLTRLFLKLIRCNGRT